MTPVCAGVYFVCIYRMICKCVEGMVGEQGQGLNQFFKNRNLLIEGVALGVPHHMFNGTASGPNVDLSCSSLQTMSTNIPLKILIFYFLFFMIKLYSQGHIVTSE
jgi:hypothetical protein